jgi:HEAT repeat protein
VRKVLAICAAVLLAGCGGKPTADWIEKLRSADSAQRLHAIKALENKKSEATTVVPALAGVLVDESPFVRRDAARALGGFGAAGKSARPALLALLGDRNVGVRKAAAAALAAIDPEAAAKGRAP